MKKIGYSKNDPIACCFEDIAATLINLYFVLFERLKNPNITMKMYWSFVENVWDFVRTNAIVDETNSTNLANQLGYKGYYMVYFDTSTRGLNKKNCKDDGAGEIAPFKST